MKKLLIMLLVAASTLSALATTINAVNRFGWGANFGWLDCRADTNNGAIIGEYICSGYIYSANVGWINLGNGSPTNGIHYQNIAASDFGVNQDGLGNLRGYAWGANIGWINFENVGAPKVDLLTGRLSGHIYSANCGWISLSNSTAYVQTDTITQGVYDRSLIPLAWQLQNFGTTGIDPNADPDGDGLSNLQEYLDGTNPNDPNDKFAITSILFDDPSVALTWNSHLTRFYYIQGTSDLNSPTWIDSGLGLIVPGGLSTTGKFTMSGPLQFYRIQSVRPLQ